jgi:hypothetical protein
MTTEDQMKGPLKHRTLSAAIVDQLRQSILDGTYPAGSQLRQDALGEAYGVSRIPVREALFQLEAEGLVRIVPQKGAIVSELSLDEINDVFDLRGIMEPRLLAQSAPHFTERDFDGDGRLDVALYGRPSFEFLIFQNLNSYWPLKASAFRLVANLNSDMLEYGKAIADASRPG